MTNNFEVHTTYRIQHERPVIARMVFRSETGRAIASPARLQRSGVKLLDLLNVCVCIYVRESSGNVEIDKHSVGKKKRAKEKTQGAGTKDKPRNGRG